MFIEIYEMWCCKMMLGIKCVDKVANEWVTNDKKAEICGELLGEDEMDWRSMAEVPDIVHLFDRTYNKG